MPWRRVIRRRFAAEVGAVAASVAIVVDAAFVPWHESGSVHRTGFALAGAADRLGLVTGGPRRILFVCAALLPLLTALAFAAAVARLSRVVGVLGCVVGVVGLASVAVVVGTTDTSQPGPPIAAVAALIAVACGARLVLRRSPRVRHH